MIASSLAWAAAVIACGAGALAIPLNSASLVRPIDPVRQPLPTFRPSAVHLPPRPAYVPRSPAVFSRRVDVAAAADSRATDLRLTGHRDGAGRTGAVAFPGCDPTLVDASRAIPKPARTVPPTDGPFNPATSPSAEAASGWDPTWRAFVCDPTVGQAVSDCPRHVRWCPFAACSTVPGTLGARCLPPPSERLSRRWSNVASSGLEGDCIPRAAPSSPRASLLSTVLAPFAWRAAMRQTRLFGAVPSAPTSAVGNMSSSIGAPWASRCSSSEFCSDAGACVARQ
jgi:hypothetical protein